MYKEINKSLHLFCCNFFFIFFIALFSFSSYFQKNVFLSVYLNTEEELQDVLTYIEGSKDFFPSFEIFTPEMNLEFSSSRFNVDFGNIPSDQIFWSVNIYPERGQDVSRFKEKVETLMPSDNLVGLDNIDFYNQIAVNFKNLSFLFGFLWLFFVLFFLREKIKKLTFVFVFSGFMTIVFSAFSMRFLHFVSSTDIRSILQNLWLYIFVMNICLFLICNRGTFKKA
ncbi:hypothetical protein CL659_04690 [bacterium]|nr:hypothetical protein [bacterium]